MSSIFKRVPQWVRTRSEWSAVRYGSLTVGFEYKFKYGLSLKMGEHQIKILYQNTVLDNMFVGNIYTFEEAMLILGCRAQIYLNGWIGNSLISFANIYHQNGLHVANGVHDVFVGSLAPEHINQALEFIGCKHRVLTLEGYANKYLKEPRRFWR